MSNEMTGSVSAADSSPTEIKLDPPADLLEISICGAIPSHVCRVRLNSDAQMPAIFANGNSHPYQRSAPISSVSLYMEDTATGATYCLSPIRIAK